MIKILPSLASADPLNLEKEIGKVEGLHHLHIDVEDGNFVPNITFGLKTIRSACSVAQSIGFDAHLMVTNPLDYLDELAELRFQAVAFHWESAPYPMRLVNRIHKLGMKAGIALNPRTSAKEIIDYLDRVDYILLMSSEPDDAGERFQDKVLGKIAFLREQNSRIEIIVDGGINESNFNQVVSTGANGVVLGRAIFQAGNMDNLLTRLLEKGT